MMFHGKVRCNTRCPLFGKLPKRSPCRNKPCTEESFRFSRTFPAFSTVVAIDASQMAIDEGFIPSGTLPWLTEVSL